MNFTLSTQFGRPTILAQRFKSQDPDFLWGSPDLSSSPNWAHATKSQDYDLLKHAPTCQSLGFAIFTFLDAQRWSLNAFFLFNALLDWAHVSKSQECDFLRHVPACLVVPKWNFSFWSSCLNQFSGFFLKLSPPGTGVSFQKSILWLLKTCANPPSHVKLDFHLSCSCLSQFRQATRSMIAPKIGTLFQKSIKWLLKACASLLVGSFLTSSSQLQLGHA